MNTQDAIEKLRRFQRCYSDTALDFVHGRGITARGHGTLVECDSYCASLILPAAGYAYTDEEYDNHWVPVWLARRNLLGRMRDDVVDAAEQLTKLGPAYPDKEQLFAEAHAALQIAVARLTTIRESICP